VFFVKAEEQLQAMTEMNGKLLRSKIY